MYSTDMVDLMDYYDGLVGDDYGFEEVGWAIKEINRPRAFIADRIHDATREEMLMEVDYDG